MGSTRNIRIMLLDADMTQKDLGKKLGYSQPNLSKRFAYDNWREEDLKKIADACGFDMEIRFTDRRNRDIVIVNPCKN